MKTKIIEKEGKKYLAKVICKERYFYDVEINYIQDGPRKPLVTDNYEVEIDAKSFGVLPKDEEAIIRCYNENDSKSLHNSIKNNIREWITSNVNDEIIPNLNAKDVLDFPVEIEPQTE